MEFILNIGGSEWVIIIFVALVLILGTNKLPEVAKKVGRATAEYKKAKNRVETQINEYTNQNIKVTEPVDTEQQKLEKMARTTGIDPTGKSIRELRNEINDKMLAGQKNNDVKQKE